MFIQPFAIYFRSVVFLALGSFCYKICSCISQTYIPLHFNDIFACDVLGIPIMQ